MYVLNRSFTKILLDSTPYEKWSGRKPYVDYLQVFGSVVHVKTTKKVSKLEDRSSVVILVGYELGTKAYRCLDPLSFKVTISRDVIFEESHSWDFTQQSSQRVDLTLTSTIPSSEQRDQDQTLEEERPERYRSIQAIYEETQGTEEDEACFLLGEEPTSYKAAIKEDV